MAVNDTTRELGGTLGVAIVGSVFASVYGAQVAEALTKLGLPSSVIDTAKESVAAALSVAQALPGDAGRWPATLLEAFISGFSSGSLRRRGSGGSRCPCRSHLPACPARHREIYHAESSTRG